MKAVHALTTGVVLTCLSAAPALAAEEQPCWGDIATFCPDVARGGGAMIDCLSTHQDQLSPACQGYMATLNQKMNEISKPCQDDIDIFCPDAKSGAGNIANCLKDHISDLSTECQESMRR
jgi:hypothetical protein